MRLRLRAIALCCVGSPLAGCVMPQEPPGELVGAYRIEGALLENTCGSAALPAEDPLRFDVEIRKQDRAGLWLVTAPPAHPGSLADDGEFRFERQSTYVTGARQQPTELLIEMDIERLADPEAAQRQGDDRRADCRLTVIERIAGTLLRDQLDAESSEDDAPRRDPGGEPRADLIGENEIEVRAAPGSDCSAALDENGGPFERLPCAVRYELEGELIER